MPPTADLENVKAAKLQDGVLVIEVPVTPAPRENTSTACVSAPAGACDLCCVERLAETKHACGGGEWCEKSSVCLTTEEEAAGAQASERGVKQRDS